MEIIEIDEKDKEYPKRLLQIKDHPKKLYALGNILLLNKQNILGIVGSRECTEYGRKVAKNFAKELAKEDICIISGLAIGIDGAAHNGAADQKGKTIAVLGCGFNYMYPPENEWLFHKILSNGGCVITEYEPNVEPDMGYFPKRNRIISGIADGVLVVEAEYRSGSTITARYAKEQGKTVYAIPSNIDSHNGIGTNQLIIEGAKLITKSIQIQKDFFQNIEKQKQISDQPKENPKLEISSEYSPIYKILENGPMHINEIAKKQVKSISELNGILTLMEIEGYVKRLPSNQYERRV